MLRTLLLLVCAWLAPLPLCFAQAPAPAPKPAAAPAPQDPRFDILEFEVEGNTVLTTAAIERAVYPHLGEKKTIRDVENARGALELAYRSAGFSTVVVDIPVQKVEGGLVRIQVTEGRVERVVVSGARYYSQGRIVEGTPSLAQGEVPYFPEVQKDLDRLNRAGDRRVTPVLRPGSLPSTTEFELKVDDSLPLHGGLELNNRQSAGTTDLRLNASLRYDNLFQRQHSFGLQYQIAPERKDEVRVVLLNYSVPLESGRSVYGYFIKSTSNVGALGGISVLGEGSIFGLRWATPLPSVGRFSHQFTAGWDVKSFKENLTLPGTTPIRTPIRYQPVSFDWSGSYASRRSLTQASVASVLSFRGLGNEPQEFADKRFRAQTNFVALRWDLSRTQALRGNYSLYLRADGQLAGEPLVSNERYFAGGATTVRGYLESEALGDQAVRGTVELRSPSLVGAEGGGWLREGGWYAFWDGARVNTRNPLPNEPSSTSLRSAGIGFRLKSTDGAELMLVFAWPFDNTANTRERHMRTLFSAAWRF